MGFGHIPVLVEEVMALLRCEPGRTYVDATLGGGGHALEILRRTAPNGIVIGLDWDEEAVSEARKALIPFGERVKIFRENFIHLPQLLKQRSPFLNSISFGALNLARFFLQCSIISSSDEVSPFFKTIYAFIISPLNSSGMPTTTTSCTL